MTKSKKLIFLTLVVLLVVSVGAIDFASADSDSLTKKQIKKLLKIIDIVAEHEVRISALEENIKPIVFETQSGPTLTGSFVNAPIRFVALDNPYCGDNRVDTMPPSGNPSVIQYGWCPEAQPGTFFIATTEVTKTSVISVSIGNQPTDQLQIQCWTGGGGNFTLRDMQSDEIFVAEGFITQCSGNTALGMTMQATILN